MTLTSPSVFACHCAIAPTSIKVGVLVLGEDFSPGVNSLWAEETCYQVDIPDFELPVIFEATLSRTADVAV